MLKIYIVFILGLVTASSASTASSIAYTKVQACGIVAHTVTINLADPEVKVSVALASGGLGKAEPFKSIVNRTRPVAAITGTFFDTRSLIPTGDIALFGNVVHYGCIGSALCIDQDNKASIVPLREGRKTGWFGYETVLSAGPTLIRDGKVALALKHEGFRPSQLMRSTRRTAVGITENGKLVLVAVNRNASLPDVAKLMLTINVTEALLLDGGSSTGFYFQGNYLAVPSRTMTNLLVVYSSNETYMAAKSVLAPERYTASIN